MKTQQIDTDTLHALLSEVVRKFNLRYGSSEDKTLRKNVCLWSIETLLKAQGIKYNTLNLEEAYYGFFNSTK